MPPTALASHNSAPAQRENLRPVSSQLRRDHARHVGSVENFLSAPPQKTGTAFGGADSRAIVKWSTARKPFCYLTMPDGRDVFLHQDDFDGDWPPPYRAAVEFALLENNHPRCKFRAKNAKPTEAQSR